MSEPTPPTPPGKLGGLWHRHGKPILIIAAIVGVTLLIGWLLGSGCAVNMGSGSANLSGTNRATATGIGVGK